MNKKRQENDRELKKKENALLKQKEEQKTELEKLDKEIKLQESLGKELSQLGSLREAKLRGQKNQREALNSLRAAMYDACLGFYMSPDEVKQGTRYNGSPCPPPSNCIHLRNLVNSYSGMSFNLYFGDIYSGNWGGWGMAMKTFYKAVGNRFVTTDELKAILEREVQTTDYLDNR